MKKRSIYILIVLLTLFVNSGKAQWVSIPDPNFVSFLQTNFPSCMSGNMMDTSCSGITSTQWLFMSTQGISDLEGIQYFDTLTFLDCSHNYTLQYLPNLPSTLKVLNASDCSLDSLPTNLPPGLLQLLCSDNDLNFLPALPTSLYDLQCGNENNLTSLPPLPNGLKTLGCGGNSITSLPPTLPDSLQFLFCSDNPLSSLPPLPAGLLEISCFENGLTSLPPLPNSLYALYCSNNPITSIPTLPPGLLSFHCGGTNITSLPLLPSTLKVLVCWVNNLSSLPPLPTSLEHLIYSYTQVGNLSNLPPNLTRLQCDSTNCTALPPLPSTLRQLFISENPISCIDLSGTDTLEYFEFSNTGINCLSSHDVVVLMSYPNFYSFPACTFTFNPNNCPVDDNIFGTMYYDVNTNCNNDIPDYPLSNIPIHLYQGTNLIQQTISGSSGYSLNASIGSYDVLIDTTMLPFEPTCLWPGIDTTLSITVLDSIAETLNFGLECKSGFDVGAFAVYHSFNFIPGQSTDLFANIGDAALNYNVYCNTSGLNGTVQIDFSGPITFNSPVVGALIPSVSGNTLTYDISDFSTINYSDFGMTFITDTTAISGDQVCFDIIVTPGGADNYYSNNTLHHCFLVVNSYDPNIKEVSPIGDQPHPFNDWLTYTIHFQNTGTSSAIDIKIVDLLDIDLDPSTFRLLAYSHPVSVNIHNQTAVFRFDNINLPDSFSNEPQSHGFIQFKIKPFQNLPNGTTINNAANIFFDYNPAIVTNTTSTVIGSIGIQDESQIEFILYPNPANDWINLQFSEVSQNRSIELTDITGHQLSSDIIQNQNHMLLLSNFPPGIYIITVFEGRKKSSRKIVINH